MNFSDQEKSKQCISCLTRKMCQIPFKEKGTRATILLELIHSDICEPMETTAFGGYRYFLTLIDDYSRKIFVYFLKNKSEVASIFEIFKAMVEEETGQVIKCLCSDNESEHCNTFFEEFIKKNGIKHQKTALHAPAEWNCRTSELLYHRKSKIFIM